LATCACGEAPILTAMVAAKALGATCGRIISYANSGDTLIGDRSRVVGYGAVAFFAGKHCNKGQSERVKNTPPEPIKNELNVQQKKALLSFARKTIHHFLEARAIPLARGFDSGLVRKQGAFVTLKKNGHLRGCIGHMTEDRPLCQTIGAMAVQAAFNDRRFKPMTLEELSEIEIEISVLTPFRPIKSIQEIRLGIDGVLLKKEARSAVFLPQVAVEHGWNRTEMLNHLCRKAGLSSNCWGKGAQIFTFQAVVFKESDF
ncbi:MAG: AmmeMemoRadiSam system protein A, partial [Deltaproteobacteria bacterium]|nr:AmmeMemoRadiSam system protein A [Deltaproteobacteria bacterium]